MLSGVFVHLVLCVYCVTRRRVGYRELKMIRKRWTDRSRTIQRFRNRHRQLQPVESISERFPTITDPLGLRGGVYDLASKRTLSYRVSEAKVAARRFRRPDSRSTQLPTRHKRDARLSRRQPRTVAIAVLRPRRRPVTGSAPAKPGSNSANIASLWVSGALSALSRK